MDGDTVIRLIGTSGRKIVTCDVSTEKGGRLYQNLRALGWPHYTGPAQVDKRGFIIAGTDPRIIPAPMRRR